MIVLWDLDDTLVDWHARAVEGMLAREGIAHLADRVQTTFDMFHGLSDDERVLMQETLDEEGFYRHLAPKVGALEAFHASAVEHQVFIVSTPWPAHPHASPSEKTAWVAEYLGADWVKRLILTHDKTLVRGDVLIDDRDVIRGALQPDWTRIYVDMPWNQPAERTVEDVRMLRTRSAFENLPVLLEWVSHIRSREHSVPGFIDDRCHACQGLASMAHPK